MTNYREILRLDSLGLNKTQIAESLGCSRTTVIHVLRQAEASCISYPLPEGMSDKELSEKLYPPYDDYFAPWKAPYRTLESTILLYGKHQSATRKARKLSCS